MTNREVEELNRIKGEVATAWFNINVDNDNSPEFDKATEDIYAIIDNAIKAEKQRRRENANKG